MIAKSVLCMIENIDIYYEMFLSLTVANIEFPVMQSTNDSVRA